MPTEPPPSSVRQLPPSIPTVGLPGTRRPARSSSTTPSVVRAAGRRSRRYSPTDSAPRTGSASSSQGKRAGRLCANPVDRVSTMDEGRPLRPQRGRTTYRAASRLRPYGKIALGLPPIVACIHARLASRHAPNACTSAPWYGAVVWKDGRGGRRLPHRRAPLAAALPARRGGSGSASSPEKHASASGACFRSEDALSGASEAGVSALPRGASAGRRRAPTARRRRRTARWGSPGRSPEP